MSWPYIVAPHVPVRSTNGSTIYMPTMTSRSRCGPSAQKSKPGRLYVSSVEHHAIRVRDGDRLTTLLRDKHVVWPDTFSEGADGTIYVTDSRIPDMSWFDPQSPVALPTRLYAIREPNDCLHPLADEDDLLDV